jgi:DNA polymerase
MDAKVRPVPGVGPATAKLVFVGRNPGAQENKEGKPFVGVSGEGPFKALLKAFGVKRQHVGILNTLSCFTPDPWNRAPDQHELKACRKHLEDQLAFFKRCRLVIPLGREATFWALGQEVSMNAVEGLRFEVPGLSRVVLPIRHPSFFLRDRSEAKRFGRTRLPSIVRAVQKELTQ